MTATMIILTSCVLLAVLVQHEPCFAANSPLAGKSFSVKTKISRQESAPQLELLLEESYSKSQNRAKIRYLASENAGDMKQREFHYDAYSKHGLLYSRTQNTCDQVELTRFYSTNLNFHTDFIRLLQAEIPSSSPVIGTARLLLLVAEQATLLREPSEALVLGIPVIKYNFDVALLGGGNGSLRVYYDSLTHDPGSLEKQLPILIGWRSLWLHYVQLEIQHEVGEQIETSSSYALPNGGEQSADILLDKFSIPTTSNCIQTLPKYNIYSTYDMQSFKFSFEAETLDSSGFLEHYWVQFDGLLQALRVDSHQHGDPDDLKSSIFNLRKDKRYLITAASGEKQCLVMKNLGMGRANLRLSNLLLGEGMLGLVGRTKVRGINALLYATTSDKLPYWFDQPALYRANNIETLRRRGVSPDEFYANNEDAPTSGNRSDPSVQRKDRYKLLVYLETGKLNRLLALEVYDLFVGESRMLLSAKFRDFAWNLAETPDGSEANDVFALADSCSARPIEDHYLGVDLLLRQNEVVAIADSSTQGSWVQDWPTRNFAILVGLADSLDLDCTMIHALKSRVRRDRRMAIDVHFKLAEQAQLLRSLKLIGRANLKPSSNSMRELLFHHKGSALLLTDCVSLAAAKNQLKVSPTYVYYSEQHFACLIDPTLDGVDEKDLFKSPLIELVSRPGEAATGELYQVETYLDYSSNTGMMKDRRLKDLENRIIPLTLATGKPAQPIDPAIFMMRIERMKIDNHNYYLDFGPANQRASYPGLAFSVEDKTNRHIEPKTGTDQPVRLSQCQAACLADHRCSAYSYCVRFPASECILSEVPASEIGKNLTETKLQSSGQVLAIQTEAYGDVMLRKDPRCELHQKSYRSQFIRGDREKNVLYGHWTIPVSNVDECAQSCFMKTLEALKSIAHETGPTKKHLSRVCTRFLYLNSLLNDAQRKALEEAIGVHEFDIEAHLGGFCSIKHEEDTKRNSSLKVFFNFDYYDFDFTTLYEKTFGLSLAETSNELEKATQVRLYNQAPRQEDHEILENADREGRNVQTMLVASLSEQMCAKKCLMQTTLLLPACRSFDVIRVSQPEPKRSYLICLFNTKLLANQSERDHHHYESDSLSIEERWHYDPRWDLIKQALDSVAHSAHLGDENCQQSGLLKSTVIVACLLILATISGFILGISLTEKFSPQLESSPNAARPLNRDIDGDIAME